MVLSTEDAAELMRRAVRRRADGSRGLWARRAWRRLVQACAEGDPAAQEAVRATAADLPEPDVQDLLAAAPREPADAAAYLALIGQSAQSRALDPDGSLLALAYRAAPADMRERLRTVMAADGDTDVIRVVVTGDQRDRIAEMSYAELDYLGRHLAERHSWEELRRLARDLPLAEAAAVARLLPPREQRGAVAELAEASAGRLRGMIERLPRQGLIRHRVAGGFPRACLSPDGTEVALCYEVWKSSGNHYELHTETLGLDTGEVASCFRRKVPRGLGAGAPVLHLGEEILLHMRAKNPRSQIFRVRPDVRAIGEPARLSVPRRSSGNGAIMLYPQGFAFVDRGADRLRFLPVPPFARNEERGELALGHPTTTLTTLPAEGLVALCSHDTAYIAREDGHVLHRVELVNRTDFFAPVLSFLSPTSLVRHHKASTPDRHLTEIWEFPEPHGPPRRTARHEGAILDRWPVDTWRGYALDDAFAAHVHTPNGRWPADDRHWARQVPEKVLRRLLLATSPGQDIHVVFCNDFGFEVHIPDLPSARELLEQPLLHCGPQDVRRARELRTKIGDPAVRDALDLLAACLEERFGGDIALGSGPLVAGGATDIALGEGGEGT
ncbi:hypothetical protein [Streptomyces sp. NPDC048825]|uniref:hypothetical protein n=1 Tax=Streptomyces sp. NPDC048825 TaxID=3365592 RepID=UPI00371B776D